MKVSVPACAPPVPPETGASSISWPAAAAAALTSRAVATSMVEQSMSRLPGACGGDQPLGAKIGVADMLARGQHGDDGFHVLGGFACRGGDGHASASELRHGRLRQVENLEAVAGLD